MATLNNELTRDLYHAGASRHAFTLLVDLARAHKHASNTEREALKRLSEEGAHLYYDPDGYIGEPFLGLNAVSGRPIDTQEAGVGDWFAAVKAIILDKEDYDETVPANRPEIMSALALMNFGTQWAYLLPIIPENWMIALYRGLADSYMVNVVRHLNGEWPNR